MKRPGLKRFFLLFLLSTFFICGAQPCFNVSPLPSDSSTHSVCMNDLNNDGYNDLAVGNFGSSSISIFLNTGTGTFNAPTHFVSSGMDPRGITAADFNGDGISDLAVANYYTYDIAVTFGSGTGAFGSPTSYMIGGPGSGYWCRAITNVDLNGDGKIDLIATGDDYVIAVFLNTGSGIFGTATHYLLATNTGPHDIIATDLNNDGILDLATADGVSNDAAVLFGTGSGTFGAATYYSTGLNPTAIFCADLNNDGIKDLATANPGSGDVSVLLGTGAGMFSPAVNYTVGSNPSYLVVTDFDQDCNVDIAVTKESPAGVVLLKGNGTGTFGAPILFSMASSPWQICMADFDKDGKMDLATTTGVDVSVLMNCSVGPCTMEVDEIKKKSLSVYPNPATDFISLKLDVNSEKAIVVIENALGQKVKELSFGEQMNVSDLPPGVYLLKVYSAGESYQAKIIKQ